MVSSLTACAGVRSTIGTELPIVFISDDKSDAPEAYAAGCIDFMSSTEVEKLAGRLLTYARVSNMRVKLEKLLAKPL